MYVVEQVKNNMEIPQEQKLSTTLGLNIGSFAYFFTRFLQSYWSC